MPRDTTHNSQARPGVRRVVFLTDIVTPYMVRVFESLAELVDLHVVFCSETGTRGMPWQVERSFPFAHTVVDGLVVRRSNPGAATDYYLSPRVFAALARVRPDVIVAAGYSVPTLYAAAYAALFGAKLLIHSDGTSKSERDISALQRLARRVLLRASSGCVANSEPAARRFRELGVAASRLFSAPHSTELAPLWAVADARGYDSTGPLRVLAVGQLISRKGNDRLLHAVRVALDRGADITVEIVGTGPEQDTLLALGHELALDDRLELSDFVEPAKLAGHFAAADVFAFPTLDDPFGFVLLEAMAAGLPAIASPLGGATEDLVVDGETGLVADPRDTDAWATAVVRMADDAGLRERLGTAAALATRSRTPEASAEGYVDAIEAVSRAHVRSAGRR